MIRFSRVSTSTRRPSTCIVDVHTRSWCSKSKRSFARTIGPQAHPQTEPLAAFEAFVQLGSQLHRRLVACAARGRHLLLQTQSHFLSLRERLAFIDRTSSDTRLVILHKCLMFLPFTVHSHGNENELVFIALLCVLIETDYKYSYFNNV